MPVLCRYRGPLLLHASAGMTWNEYGAAARAINVITGRDDSVPSFRDLSRGGVVGVCTVLAHVTPHRHLWRDAAEKEPDNDLKELLDWRWAAIGSYGLVLAYVRPLPFVAFKGALGFFDVPDDLVPGARP